MHFPYILTLTLPLLSVFDGIVHSSAQCKLLFIIHIGGGLRVVVNFIVSNSGESFINKLTSNLNSGATTTSKTIEKHINLD